MISSMSATRTYSHPPPESPGPWVDRYRPETMDELVGQEYIVSTVRQFIHQGTFPHLLFHGPPGCGKTTVSQCLVTQLYGSATLARLVINASNERGIDTVRNKIRAFAGCDARALMPVECRHLHKTVVLDEFDSMTTTAQNSLRQLMENCHGTRFVLICNELDRIDMAIQSRCASFRFGRLSDADARRMIERVCAREELTLDEDCVQTVIQVSKGDLRAVINTLQQVASLTGTVTTDRICQITGNLALLYWKPLYRIWSSRRLGFRDRVRQTQDLIADQPVALSRTLLPIIQRVLASERSVQDKIRIVTRLAEVEDALRTQIPAEVAVYTLATVF